jgi:hypothetical protein
MPEEVPAALPTIPFLLRCTRCEVAGEGQGHPEICGHLGACPDAACDGVIVGKRKREEEASDEQPPDG